MKISLSVSEESYKDIEKKLLALGFIIDDDAPFVLTERMLNSCIFSGIQSECGISAVYVIEAREEVYINFNDVDEAMRKLEAVLEACFRNTF